MARLGEGETASTTKRFWPFVNPRLSFAAGLAKACCGPLFSFPFLFSARIREPPLDGPIMSISARDLQDLQRCFGTRFWIHSPSSFFHSSSSCCLDPTLRCAVDPERTARVYFEASCHMLGAGTSQAGICCKPVWIPMFVILLRISFAFRNGRGICESEADLQPEG